MKSLCAKQQVKVLDFGIAGFVAGPSGLTRGDARIGTPDYMAPEQHRSGQCGPAADLYALGMILFEMLTGRRAFGPFDTDYQLMRAHIEEPTPRPSSLREGIPSALDAVVLRATAKDPAGRFASCYDMLEALEAALPRNQSAPPPVARAPVVATPAPVPIAWAPTPVPGVAVPPPERPRASVVTPPAGVEPVPDSAPPSPPRTFRSVHALFIAAALTVVVGVLAAVTQSSPSPEASLVGVWRIDVERTVDSNSVLQTPSPELRRKAIEALQKDFGRKTLEYTADNKLYRREGSKTEESGTWRVLGEESNELTVETTFLRGGEELKYSGVVVIDGDRMTDSTDEWTFHLVRGAP